MWALLTRKINTVISRTIFKFKSLWFQTKFKCKSLWFQTKFKCKSLSLQTKIFYIKLKLVIKKILVIIQEIFNFSIIYTLFIFFILCCAAGLIILVLLCLLVIDMWVSPLDSIHILVNLWQKCLYSLQNTFNILKESILSLNIKHERSELLKLSSDEIKLIKKINKLDDNSLEIAKENQQLLKDNKEKKDNNASTTKNKILIWVGIAALVLTASYFGIGYLIYTDCVENHDRVFWDGCYYDTYWNYITGNPILSMPIEEATRLRLEAIARHEGGFFEGYELVQEETCQVLVQKTYPTFRHFLCHLIINNWAGWRRNPYFEFNRESLYLRQMPFFEAHPVEFYEAVYNGLSINGKINYLVNEHVFMQNLLNDVNNDMEIL